MNPTIEALSIAHAEVGGCLADLQAAFELLRTSYRQGGKLLVCGNGGSASDSEHIVGELMKSFKARRAIPADVRARLLAASPDSGTYLADRLQGALPAISLVSQTSLLTAFANDVDPNLIFAQQVYGYGRTGDVLLAISTSGLARNVLYALQVARATGVRTLGLTGPDGGEMPPLCDVLIRAPGENTNGIQERHLAIYHALCAALEQEFFPQ